jgi:hypothetical protein
VVVVGGGTREEVVKEQWSVLRKKDVAFEEVGALNI